MRVILAGQRSFGVAVHDMLLAEGHDIVAVWSPDDGIDKLTRKAWSLRMFPDTRSPERVKELEVDLFVVAHSHDFIGRQSRAATRLGGVGYHPSLLPRHRGRDAVRWTVHLGDPITGGTVYWLTDNVDGGPIAAQDWCFVKPYERIQVESGIASLWREKLFPMGVRLLRDVLRDLDRGVMVEIPQDEEVATWEPSWERPPLHRPEVPQLGSNGEMTHITSRDYDSQEGRSFLNTPTGHPHPGYP